MIQGMASMRYSKQLTQRWCGDMIKLSVFVIAVCYLANTAAVYHSDEGGVNIYFGNFGYHIEGE